MSTTGEVLAAARHLARAFGRHDTAAYFGCFAPDATFIFHTTAARLTSRAEYQRSPRSRSCRTPATPPSSAMTSPP